MNWSVIVDRVSGGENHRVIREVGGGRIGAVGTGVLAETAGQTFLDGNLHSL